MDDEHNEDDEEEKETEKSIFVGSSTIWSNSSLDKEKEKPIISTEVNYGCASFLC